MDENKQFCEGTKEAVPKQNESQQKTMQIGKEQENMVQQNELQASVTQEYGMEQNIAKENVAPQNMTEQNVPSAGFVGQSVVQPNISGPSVTQQNGMQPNMSGPSVTQQNGMQPNMSGLSVTQQNGMQPNMSGSGVTQQNGGQHNIMRPGLSQQNPWQQYEVTWSERNQQGQTKPGWNGGQYGSQTPWQQSGIPGMQGNFMQQVPVLSKQEIKKCRHKSELRWYYALCILNVFVVIGLLAFCGYYMGKKMPDIKKAYHEIMLESAKEVEKEASTPEEKKDAKKIRKVYEKKVKEDKKQTKKQEKEQEEEIVEQEQLDEVFLYVILFFGALICLPIIVTYFYQQVRISSIRITERNFPEVYARVQLYARMLGMKKVPEVYIVQQNGILNAFSAFILNKQYIEIYADIFEVAYREHKDLDTISFILAHEMAHIHYKHATFGYAVKIYFSKMIPILGATASRAREYSCDRLAQRLTGTDGVEAMFALVAGKHLYKMVDKQDYLMYANSVRGFFVWYLNLTADHPIMTKRIPALMMREGSGKLY